MRFLVIGAGGRTGRAVVSRAVEAGHHVTALVHTAGEGVDPRVDVRVGDARDPAILDAVIGAQDAVIDTVGPSRPTGRSRLETEIALALVQAMQRHGTSRLLVTSSVGVGDSRAVTPAMVRVLAATYLRGAQADKTAMEEVVRRSGLEWVITRPAVLTDDAETGHVEVVPLDGGRRAHVITRGDLARFLVDEAEAARFTRQALVVANR